MVKDGEFRVAQYGQWDHYLTGQGNSIVNFLLNDYDADLLKSQVDKIRHLTREDVKARWEECGADDSGFVDWDVSETFRGKYMHLSRDCGSHILKLIQEMEEPEVFMDLDFAADSLFCEWCYVLDLDTETLEIYKGFNTDGPVPATERFAVLNDKEQPSHRKEKEYWPVKLVRTFQFSELTEDSMRNLEMELYPDEEDDG